MGEKMNDITKFPPPTKEEEEEMGRDDYNFDEFQKMLLSTLQQLPKEKNWISGSSLHFYKGCWYPTQQIEELLFFEKHFQAQPTDIILATAPKSGTTWLKALAFAIVNRSRFSLDKSPLLTTSPHRLVPFFNSQLMRQFSGLYSFPAPRIFATHCTPAALPASVTDEDSGAKIVYMCRNPLDQFISLWHFLCRFPDHDMELSLEDAFDKFCEGFHAFGPFWDHILGFREVSSRMPEKVLFLKYEDMKADGPSCVKKLAAFLGQPFGEEEEKQGVVEGILRICSFETMSNLEVNKTEIIGDARVASRAFFRSGKVGDWHNYLSPAMAERMEKLIQEKLGDADISFNL